jgi:hypothetical protein
LRSHAREGSGFGDSDRVTCDRTRAASTGLALGQGEW